MLTLTLHGFIDKLGMLQCDGNISKRRTAWTELHDTVRAEMVLGGEVRELHKPNPIVVATVDGRLMGIGDEAVPLLIVEVVGRHSTILVELVGWRLTL